MHFHIILTERCNSQCRYCYGKSMEDDGEKLNKTFKFNYSIPVESEVDVSKLRNFLDKDENPTLIFYGGEPLCNFEKMKEIMDCLLNGNCFQGSPTTSSDFALTTCTRARAFWREALPRECSPAPDSIFVSNKLAGSNSLANSIKFCMQTNGKLLDKVPEEYIKRFSKILISIDGDKERTDFNRGKGTYDKVLENIKLIRERGFDGELVARMTISFSDGFTDVSKQVKHLFGVGFDSVHWQLDMGFYKGDYNKEKVEKFVEEYNKEVDRLMIWWVSEMEKGKVWRVYPFVGIVESLLKGEKTKLRCGSGYSGYTITTDGNLVCCPIMNSITNFYVGDLDSNPKNLKNIFVKGSCDSCDYLDLCGGRCLYSNYARLWPKEGEELICKTVKHLIDELKKRVIEIKKLIDEGKIKKEDFEYEKYFGPEIIP